MQGCSAIAVTVLPELEESLCSVSVRQGHQVPDQSRPSSQSRRDVPRIARRFIAGWLAADAESRRDG
jgi:hypothetical protein